VFQQELDDALARVDVPRDEAQRLEVLVGAYQLRRRAGKEIEESFERGAIERLLQVFDDVELDAALAQDLQRAARLASAGVVVEHLRRHGSPPLDVVGCRV
jgi:hypothetical protein